MNKNEKRAQFITCSVYYAIIILLVCLFIKYLLGPLLPFIFAFITVASSRRLILRLEDGCHSKRFASIVFTLLLIAVLSLVVYAACYGLFREIKRLSESISDISVTSFIDSISQKTTDLLGTLSSSKFFGRISDDILSFMGNLDKVLTQLATSSLPEIMSFLMRFISFFPSAVIFLCFMFISMFYISVDYEKILKFVMMQLPDRILDTFDETKSIIVSTAKELFKSYFLLTFIIFLQLLTGFLIIGIDYALTLALIISIIDLLPVLGTGTILLPWAAICFITGDIPTGAGLIVLYAVITVFRQAAGPKIIGAGADLPPIISLISIFLGLELLGLWGIVIFPIIASTIIKLNRKGFIRLYRNFPENPCENLKKTRIKFLNFKKNDSYSHNKQGSDSDDKHDCDN